MSQGSVGPCSIERRPAAERLDHRGRRRARTAAATITAIAVVTIAAPAVGADGRSPAARISVDAGTTEGSAGPTGPTGPTGPKGPPGDTEPPDNTELKDLLIVPVSVHNGTGTPPVAWFDQQGQKLTDRFREISYNHDIYDHDVVPVTWYWLPGSSPGCLSGHLAELADLVESTGVDPAGYNRVIFWWEKGSCGSISTNPHYAGGGTSMGKWIWADATGEPTWARFLGILDGLPPTSGYQCSPADPNGVAPPASCITHHGVQPFDLLNPVWPSDSLRGHPPAASKFAAGWLTQYVEAPMGQTTSHILAPYETTGPELRAIRMKTPDGQDVWIEYRTGAGTDGYQSSWPNVFDGVQVYAGPGGRTLLDFGVATQGGTAASYQDATLPPGQTWTHPSGLTVTVTGSSPDPHHDQWVQVTVHQPIIPAPPTSVGIDGDPLSNHLRVTWQDPGIGFTPDEYEVTFNSPALGASPEVHTVPGTSTSALMDATYPVRPRLLTASIRARFGALWSAPGAAQRDVRVEALSFDTTPAGNFTATAHWQLKPLDPLLDPPDQMAILAPGSPACLQGAPFAMGATTTIKLLQGGQGFTQLRYVYSDDPIGALFSGMISSDQIDVPGNDLAMESFDSSYDAANDRVRLDWSLDGTGAIGFLGHWCDVVNLQVHTRLVPSGSATGTWIQGQIDGAVFTGVTAIGPGATMATVVPMRFAVGYETHPVSYAPSAFDELGPDEHLGTVTVQLDQPSAIGGLRLISAPDPVGSLCNSTLGILAIAAGSSTGTFSIRWYGNSTPGPDQPCPLQETDGAGGVSFTYQLLIKDDD